MVAPTVADRYQILRVLGSGNVTNTYLAKDLRHPDWTRCVIKQLIQAPPDPKLFDVNRQLFAREIDTLRILGAHSQVPSLLDAFEWAGGSYFVQEYIDGHSLAEELPKGAWWQVPRVIRFLEDMLNLLVFVHGHGIVHRDIKPTNIMCGYRSSQLVLVDFGAAYPLSLVSSDALSKVPEVVVGTPGYMATEQAVGNPQFSSDLYSLGMIAVQALIGKSPRQLGTMRAGELDWRQDIKAAAAVVDMLSQLVHPCHDQRFQSAAEALTAVRAVSAALPDPVVESSAVLERPRCLRCYARIDNTGTESEDTAVMVQENSPTVALKGARIRLPAFLQRWLLTLSGSAVTGAAEFATILLSLKFTPELQQERLGEDNQPSAYAYP